jgi:hypothetical protein
MPSIAPEALADLIILLHTTEAIEWFNKINGTSESADVDRLIRGFELAATPAEAIAACADIASLLVNTYQVSHGDLKRNQILKDGLIENLTNLVEAGLAEVRFQLEISPDATHNLDNLAKIAQACAIVAEYYSVNDQVATYMIWMEKTEKFIHEAGLATHLSYAALLETKASEISRRLTQQNPHGTIEECIALFYQALEIYKINGITIDGPDSSARHTQNSLCVAISKQILSIVEQAPEISPELMTNIKSKSDEAFKLLEEIEIPFLKPGVDVATLHANSYATLDIKAQVADPKRMSNMLSTRALIELLNNKINDNTKTILVKSLESMPKEAIPQYANTLNRNANFNLAYAALIYNYAINQQQDPSAHMLLKSILEHDYVKVANKFFAYETDKNLELASIAQADKLVAEAVQLYVDAFTITRGNAGETYGKVAEKFLVKIAEHPACQNNAAAIDIIANALQGQLCTNGSGALMTPCFINTKAQVVTNDESAAPRPSVMP